MGRHGQQKEQDSDVLIMEISFFKFSPRSRDWYLAECVN